MMETDTKEREINCRVEEVEVGGGWVGGMANVKAE